MSSRGYGIASVWGVVAALMVVWCGSAAHAQETTLAMEREGTQTVHVQTGTSLQDVGSVELGWQGRLTERFRLGLEVEGAAYRVAYIEALEVEDGWRGRIGVPATLAFFERGPMTSHLLLAPELYVTQAPDDSGLDNAIALGGTAGFIFQARASSRLTFETGALVPYVQEVAPSSLLEKTGLIIPAGLGWWVTDQLQFFALGRFGPLAGGGGDTAKFLATASVGLRIGLDGMADVLISP